jgi:hypothetical protein
MKKLITYTLLSIAFVLQACDSDSSTLNKQTKEHFSNSDNNANKSTREQLEDYYQAMLDGNRDVIVKYLHGDVVQHINSITNFEFELVEFIDEELVKQAIHAKKVYDENGIRHYFKVVKQSESIKVGDKEVQSFAVLDILEKGEKIKADTSNILGISKNGITKFTSSIEDPEKVLSYSFSQDEILTILNLVHDGKYQAYLDKNHTKLLNSHIWTLEAFGKNSDKLAAFKPLVKEAILEQGLGSLPERLSIHNDKLNIQLIDGKQYADRFSVSGGNIRFNVPTVGNDFKYVIQKTGVDENGDPIYYLDIYYTDGNDTVVLVYIATKQESV